ncbi:MAG: PspC domain-containing protein [Spirosomataceae bacterium]
MSTQNKLYRIPSEGKLGGVAAGLAEYFNTDVALVRILMVLAFFFPHGVPVVLGYIIMWIALPKKETVITTRTDTPSAEVM